MKIIKIKVLRGPNIWSIRRPDLIDMLLDLEELEQKPTNKIPGFYERLLKLLPSMYEHRCSEETAGGFFYRVRTGTWMGHVIEHIALELQSLADMEVGFGRTRETNTSGVYHVVFNYLDSEAGVYAARAAVDIAQSLVDGTEYDLNNALLNLRNIWSRNKLGPSTESLVKEAKSRGIPVLRLNDQSLVQLGYGKNQQRIEATITGRTGTIAVDIAGDKSATKKLLHNAGVPVPFGTIIEEEKELVRAIEKVGFPLVIKPLDGNHGRGASTNIRSLPEAYEAFAIAQKISRKVICEKFITGSDFRVLVIDGRFVAAAKRTPASITGDGKQTIRQLIDRINSDPARGDGHDNVLTTIVIDEVTRKMLAEKKLTTESILPDQFELALKPTANISTGGTAEDVTDHVHPANVSMFERIARIVGLDICGIDIMAPDLQTILKKNGGAVLEVNAAPGFRMHLQPSSGKKRNVAKHVIDMLFPEGRSARIPLIAVTGTNGKTTTTRLIAHIMKQSGLYTGYTTTDGIYIGDEHVEKGDCSGPGSAQVVLKDPAVECAVLECARGGLLRSGLGFDRCSVGVITNVAADHLGLDDIHNLDQLARVKSVIADSILDSGTAVLNADDDRVYRIRKDLDCRVSLFSTDPNSERLSEHCARGGTAATIENGFITLLIGHYRIPLEHVSKVPCTFNGNALFNVSNVLAAILAAHAENVPVDNIIEGICSFQNSAEHTPGRLNFFEYRRAKVLLDYAHNPHGISALGKFITSIPCARCIGMVTAVGDRRNEDIIQVGVESAKIFDEIIIRLDDDLRGRTEDEIVNLVLQGIRQVDEHKNVRLVLKESEAINDALDNVRENELLVLLVDDTWRAIEALQQRTANAARFKEVLEARVA